MQTSSSTPLTIELEDMNSVTTAYEPALNDLGLRHTKPGQNFPECAPFCCCCCCAATGGTEDSR